MKNKEKLFATFVILSFLAGAVFVSAHSADELAAAQQLIASGVSCDQLNNTQLEMIGDYYMEQIHPGEAHEYMDAMMGGEGSQSLEQMHIAMAQAYYCNAGSYNGSYGYGMMSGGYGMGSMMNPSVNYGPSMMYNYAGSYRSFMYYLPWVLLALVVGAGIALAIVFASKNRTERKR